jgi:hypothetical protein
MQRLHRAISSAHILAVASILGSTSIQAQDSPIFELQPGIAISDFISITEEMPSNSAFSVRFSTRFRTSLKWLTPVVGAVFFPYGSTENTIRNTDAPTIFVGNIFPLLSENSTSGWLSIEVPLLVTHSPGAGSTGNVRDYGKDLVILPTAYVNIGARMLSDFGSVWSRLSLFAQLEQVLTPAKDIATGDRDFFNPMATFGFSLIVGGSRN